jgi:two-component system, sensor histidine kinase PdtaS
MAGKPPSGTDPAVLHKLRRHVRILVDLGRLTGENPNLERFLDQAVVQVARAVEVDHVKVLRYRPKSADLFMVAGMGWKDGVVRAATFPSDLRSPPGRAFQTGEPLVIEDTGAAPGFVIADVLKDHGIVSLANVPILIDGAAWGVLEVDSTVRRDFSEDTVEFLLAAALIIGAAIQRDRAYRDGANAVVEANADGQRRDVLLKELQHRVKNNFQLILASISMQKRRYEDENVHRVLDHVANRISAISLAHDQLAPRDNIHAVDMATYLRALCASIEQQTDNVAVELHADEIDLSIDRAVPLGLILNEAATNSVKHAFGEDGGRISVRLQAGVGYGEARLTVSDNGSGIENPRPGGSGLMLITTLARQIGGEVQQESSERGTSISVTFPVIT